MANLAFPDYFDWQFTIGLAIVDAAIADSRLSLVDYFR